MPETTTPDVERLMNDYFDLRNGDLSKLDVLAESFTFTHPLGEAHGPDELVALQRENAAALPDESIEVREVLVGDDVALWEWTLTGTHEGEWNDIPPTGRKIELSGASKTVIVDGKIRSNRAYFDSRDLLAQLGATE